MTLLRNETKLFEIKSFESKYVKDTYSHIAHDFSTTRHHVWPSVSKFLTLLEPHSKVFEAGCGNGRNMLFRKDLNFIGCDICPELLEICKNHTLNVILADNRNLPFADNTFDATISIAVIHHIYLFEERLKAINELIRITKVNGLIHFQVWDNFENKGKQFIKIDGTDTDHFVTWKKGDEFMKRYYHLFNESEIDKVISDLENVKLVEKSYEKNNWIITLKKI